MRGLRTSSLAGVESALYQRSVCWITAAFHGLRCHPPTCMLLNLRLSADSIPSGLTNLKLILRVI